MPARLWREDQTPTPGDPARRGWVYPSGPLDLSGRSGPGIRRLHTGMCPDPAGQAPFPVYSVIQMKHDPKDVFLLGFDLGGTKMLAAVFDDKFNTVARNRKKTKAHEGAKACLARIVVTIEEALEEAGLSAKKLGCIGVGLPGPIDLKRGVMLQTPNMGWPETPLKETLESAFGCAVVMVNDVDAGVYGEYRLGAAKAARCVVGVFPGTGIGGGCVYKGEILQGKTTSCMEIGHLPVLPDGPLCGCGRRGCLEAVASRLAISAAAAAAAHRGDAPRLLDKAGTDLADIRSGALAASIAGGDKVVEDIVRQAARWLGVGVAGAVNLLAPDVVVLGGGLVEAIPELYLEEVGKAARAHVMPSLERSFKIVAAKLGDDAVATGAATWAQAVTEKERAGER